MNRMKIEVHPAILVIILIMGSVLFFFMIKHEPEIITVKSSNNISIVAEKSFGDVYDKFPDFPYVVDTLNEDDYKPFVMDGVWWVYEEDKIMFVKTNWEY